MILPTQEKRLLRKITTLVEDMQHGMHDRATLATQLRRWRYNGAAEGDTAIYNRLEPHIARMGGYLFAPGDLRFHIEYDLEYPEDVLKRSEAAARYLTKQIEGHDIDIAFAAGVDEALTYGSYFMKLIYGNDGISAKLVPPWLFGVYREDLTKLSEQEAMMEMSYITPADLWRRISHMPGAAEMYKKAVSYAKKELSAGVTNFFHSVVISGNTPAVDTTAAGNLTPGTGGMVDVDVNSVGPSFSPNVQQSLIEFIELTILDDVVGDYTTVQFVQPDIIITPKLKKYNLFIPKETPYVLIQPNAQADYFFGRSEMAPLLKLQSLLRERLEDIKKIMSLQYDKLLAFIGFDGMNDEQYDSFKQAGWIAQSMPGAKIEDLTPKLPAEAFADIKEVLAFMDDISGFQNILSGQGESGVRSDNHAQTLMKTASPRMRKKALAVERQCSELGNKALSLLMAKDAKELWYDSGESDKAKFLLASLPDDFRVVVDSHSSSPIYEEDHKQIAAFLLKSGIIDGETVLDILQNLPMRDLLKSKYRLIEKKKAQFAAMHPELLKSSHSRSRK